MLRAYPILLALALAACVPGAAEYTKTEAPAALRLYGEQWVLTLAFAPGSARLSAGQTRQLAQWVHNGDIRPADRVDIAAGGGDRLAPARGAAIARALLRYGIVASSRALAGAPPDRVLVLIARYTVMLPPCPNWSKPSATDFTNEPSSNFGCADATNLGLMVASPADLAGGRTLGAVSGKPAASAVRQYLNNQVTPLPVSDVGPIAQTSGGGSGPMSATAAAPTDTLP